MADRAAASLSVVDAFMAASSLLCIFGGIQFGADFHSTVVASLLVQHAVRARTAACIRAGRGFFHALRCDWDSRIRSAMDEVCIDGWFWAGRLECDGSH